MSIKYEITRDPELLDQYYRLREKCYRKQLNLPDFDGSEERADRIGHIFIASKSGRCVGGARIVAANHADTDFVNSVNSIGKVNFGAGRPCLWERLSIAAEGRTDNLMRLFCGHLTNTCWALGYDYALMVSSSVNARYYRRLHSRWSVPFETFRDASFKPKGLFSGLEHVMSVAHLRPLNMQGDLPQQPAPSLVTSYQNRLAA